MKVFARHHLAAGRLKVDEPALLLEGSWPAVESSSWRWSLDQSIDARYHWLDQQAAALAERLATTPTSFAWLNIVKLRYFLVKLLRVIAFLRQEKSVPAGDRLTLFAAAGRDVAYARVLEELARDSGFEVDVHWCQAESARSPQPLASAPWRRIASQFNRWLSPDFEADATNPPRVVLCGNSRLLDPVCRELRQRQVSAWWLYERFSVGCWLRWRASGVGQLVCDAAGGEPPWSCDSERMRDVAIQGLNLQVAVGDWYTRHVAELAARQADHLAQIAAYFDAVRPTHVVLDQDGTPFNRAVVAIARRHRAKSLIVQHGVPYARFGFAPLEADQICAWGVSSRDQFLRWGIPAEQIAVTGCPAHDRLIQQLGNARRLPSAGGWRQILVFATLPPSDDRPDPVGFHLTTETYRDLLRTTLAAVSALSRTRLLVKLHPRDSDDGEIRRALAEFPQLKTTVVRNGSMDRLLTGTSTVLSFGSSAGVEATLAGVPVIELLPRGSTDLLPSGEWGFLGTARERAELDVLLQQAAEQRMLGPDPRVFANLRRSAAEQVVDVLLDSGAPPAPRGDERASPDFLRPSTAASEPV